MASGSAIGAFRERATQRASVYAADVRAYRADPMETIPGGDAEAMA